MLVVVMMMMMVMMKIMIIHWKVVSSVSGIKFRPFVRNLFATEFGRRTRERSRFERTAAECSAHGGRRRTHRRTDRRNLQAQDWTQHENLPLHSTRSAGRVRQMDRTDVGAAAAASATTGRAHSHHAN